MTSQQKITDSPIDFAEEIIEDVKNSKEDGVLKCVQCGMCTSTCPAARHSEYNPRDIIERVLDGDVTILEDENIWNCFYCYTCHSVCPVGNSVCEVNQILKQFAITNTHKLPIVNTPERPFLKWWRDRKKSVWININNLKSQKIKI